MGVAPVRQGQFGHRVHIGRGDAGAPLQRGPGAGGAQHDQVGPYAVHPGLQRPFGRALQHVVGPVHAGQPLLGRLHGCGQPRLCLRMGHLHGFGVQLKRQPGPGDGLALRHGVGVGQRHRQAKAVQQLWAQLAFFGVHGAHQHEAGGVLARNAVALHGVEAAGGHVQQGINQAIGQQVDLVHIQHAAMGTGHEAGLKPDLAFAQRSLHIQRANELLQAGRQRQGHKGRVGQQGRQRSRRGGFGRAPGAADQHTADAGVNGRQQQGALQHRLPHQGCEREHVAVAVGLAQQLACAGRFRSGMVHGCCGWPGSSSCCSRASRCCAMRSRWSPGSCHRPRCMASSRRSPTLRRASGLCCCMKARVSGSYT